MDWVSMIAASNLFDTSHDTFAAPQRRSFKLLYQTQASPTSFVLGMYRTPPKLLRPILFA